MVEKKDLSKEASHHSEKLEPAYPLRTFQNGGIISFSMQGRPGRCILRYSIAGRITEIYMLQVERQTLSICLPLFWLNFGPSSFYKVDENSNSCHKEVEWKDYNLSRQHLDNSRVRGGVIDTKRYSHFSPPELGLCNQLQEVCVRPMPCAGISGVGNRFSEYKGGAPQGKNKKDQETILVKERKNLHSC